MTDFIMYQKIPFVKIPKMLVKTVKQYPSQKMKVMTLRQAWKLGLMNPIENLMALLEDQGVKVGLVDAPDDFDACVMWANESIPVMVVKRGLPGDRQRFSLAHELGHIALKNESEKAAYRFAAAFLAF